MTNAMNSLIKDEMEQGQPPKMKKQAPIYPNLDSIELQDPDNKQDCCTFLVQGFMFMVLGAILACYHLQPSSSSRNLLANRAQEIDTHLNGNLREESLYTPQQLHLSLGSDSNEIYITWSTMETVKDGKYYVEICKRSDNPNMGCAEQVRNITGKIYSRQFLNNDESWYNVTRRKSRQIITYRALVRNLEVQSTYTYRAVSEIKQGINCNKCTWYSKTYQFTARNFSDTAGHFRVAFYGDLGLINGQSIPQLISEVDNGLQDLIIHNGDFAYDLNTHNGEYGDEFMRKIEPIAARLPYQTSVGNHEIANNFSHYDHRFTMVNSGGHNVGQQNNFYYSFNVGPVHYIGFSTEFYYFLETVGFQSLSNQYEWLKRDLELASSPEERSKRPWIIVFGHRPMYCSSRDNDDCSKDSNILRKGLPFSGLYALEKLFYDYGVDVQLYSHEHMYERFLPIYDGQVYLDKKSTTMDRHLDAKAPVHMISGSAGCQERLDPFKNKPATGSIKQISDYGFLRIRATTCMIEFEQYSTDEFHVVDRLSLSKTRSQNFPTIKDAVILNCTGEAAANLRRERTRRPYAMGSSLDSEIGPNWFDDQSM